ncbi:MAG: hypothetical protein ACOYNI_03205 [Acidimicrobiia bacterium]
MRARSTARAFTRARIDAPSTWWSSRLPRAWIDDDGTVLVYDWAGGAESPSARRPPTGDLVRTGSGWIIATLIYSGLGLFVGGLAIYAALTPVRVPDSFFALAFGAGFLWFATLPLQRWSKIRQLVADYDAGTALALEPSEATMREDLCAVTFELDQAVASEIVADLGLRSAEELDWSLLNEQCRLLGLGNDTPRVSADGATFECGGRTWTRWCAAQVDSGVVLIIDDRGPSGPPSGLAWGRSDAGDPFPTPESVAAVAEALARIHPRMGEARLVVSHP